MGAMEHTSAGREILKEFGSTYGALFRGELGEKYVKATTGNAKKGLSEQLSLMEASTDAGSVGKRSGSATPNGSSTPAVSPGRHEDSADNIFHTSSSSAAAAVEAAI